jgi:four helix bundle protein
MHNLDGLKIWHKSIELSLEVYKSTNAFPREEMYGLTSQVRKSAVSIASNIADGAGRNSENEFIHFLGIANGSAYELQTQIIISGKLGLMSYEMVDSLLKSINENQMLNYGLQESLKNKRR